MKRIIYLLCLVPLLVAANLTTDRVITPKKDGGAVVLQGTTTGGVASDALTVNDSGVVIVGPTATQSANQPKHLLNGQINAGATGASDLNIQSWYGNNAYVDSSWGVRTSSGISGSAIRLISRTADSDDVFRVYANQAADTTTTAGDIVAASTANGAWTLGVTSGTQTHVVNGKIQLSEAGQDYPATTRAGNVVSVANGGTFDITTPSTRFFGVLNIDCNSTSSGDYQTYKMVKVYYGGGGGGTAVQAIGTDMSGSNSCSYAVSVPATSTIRVTNSGACNAGASHAMTCRWHLTTQRAD